MLLKPKVSVLMITYNHEKFISEAIEGVIMQQTDFDFQLVICDDFSKDNTPNICKEYKEKYPSKITLQLNEKNMGGNGMPNLINGYQYCMESKYLAICEGDDYWTSPHKLQKQVDFLENNPDFVICFHNSEVKSFEGNHPSYFLNNNIEKDVFTLDDLIGDDEIWFMATASILYSRAALGEMPEWLKCSLSGDIPMHILAARHGKIKYLDEVMSVYRKNMGGASFTDNKKDEVFLRNRIFMYENLDKETGYKYHEKLKKNIARYYLMMLESFQFEGKKAKKALFAIKYLEMARPNFQVVKDVLKNYIIPDILLKIKRGNIIG